jgi:nucleoside-diphosphate-sugar epimerase
MRVFVTGASGFIGKAVTKELQDAGHQVLGLASSDKSADLLTSLGAEVQRGSLDDLDSLKQGAAASDGVIHLAFKHDFSKFAESCSTDRAAIEAIGSVLQGSNRPFVIASGTGLLPPGQLGDEDVPYYSSNPLGALRGPSEALTHSFEGVRSSVVRLPPSVHGDGDKGFLAFMIGIARQKGVSAYVGDVPTHWPSTHRLDAAKVFRLALEKGKAGSTFHAIAEEGVPIKDIAEVVGEKLNIPVVSVTAAEAPEHYGLMSFCFLMNNLASSVKTKEQLGWNPVQKTILDDLKEGTYFDAK